MPGQAERDQTAAPAPNALEARVEALEVENRRLEGVVRLKNEIIASASHEIRTSLNPIVGFTELLHDGKVGPVAPEHREFLADILTSARHLLRLLNDLLDIAKIDAGKMEFHPTEVDLEGSIAEVRDILRGQAARKRLAVDIECDPAVATVVVDRSKLVQVLYNFVSNAVKFTPAGGKVLVRGSAAGPDRFRVEVCDTGPGVAEQDREKLFVEFQQVGPAEGRAQSTGLGLAVNRRIVEAQGGRVGLDSAAGFSSCFYAELPRRAPVPASSPK